MIYTASELIPLMPLGGGKKYLCELTLTGESGNTYTTNGLDLSAVTVQGKRVIRVWAGIKGGGYIPEGNGTLLRLQTPTDASTEVSNGTSLASWSGKVLAVLG